MATLLAVLLAMTAAPSPSAAHAIVIRNGAALSAGGFTIVLHPDGSMIVTAQDGERPMTASASSLQAIYAAVHASVPLSAVHVRSCRHLMSSGGALSVEFGGSRTPGDLSCGGGEAANTLLSAVNAIVAQARIPAISRMRPGM